MKSTSVAVTAWLFSTVIAAAQQPATGGPVFDVVSIRPAPGSTRLSNIRERPGGFTLEKGTVQDLLVHAYAIPPADILGLPGWASRDVYDVAATASAVSPSLEVRRTMVRALLADRFRLRAHDGTREQPSFDLIKARPDGRLGPALIPHDVDCAARANAEREARAAGKEPEPDSKQPPCTVGIRRTGLSGQMSMDLLANVLRSFVGRPVVDKTGLTGTYRVQLEFDPSAGLSTDSRGDAGPSVFSALQEQLGLKLEPSRAPAPVLVIDAIEPPTEN